MLFRSEQNEIKLNPLFVFEESGEDDAGRVVGKLCGKGGLFHEDKLKAAGIT